MRVRGDLTITNCTIANNVANGGAVSMSPGGGYQIDTSISGTIICGNGPEPIDGLWTDDGGNCISEQCEDTNGDGLVDACGCQGEACTCRGDVNEDDVIDAGDLIELLAAWGTDEPRMDFDENGIVDVRDLIAMLAAWGPCP